MRLLYSNKDDPRIFVYQTENKSYGVTFNCAHRKGRIMMVGVLVLGIVPGLCFTLMSCANIFKSSCSLAGASNLLTVYYVCFSIGGVIWGFRSAARDLQRHPGLNGPRNTKGVKGLCKEK